MASMAGTQPSSPLDTLQLMINDVLVNMGKALRSSQRDSKRAPSSSSTTRAYEANEKFNSALDDLEQELIEAKAVLYRDLDRLRASKLQPAVPEPVPAPAPEPVAAQQAPPAPMTLDGPPLDLSGPSGQLMADSKPIAPFPNMDLEPSAPVPQMMAETKMEIQSPQPATKVDPTVPRGPVQNEAPNHLSVAKTRSPNLTKASPAAKVESPASVASKTTMQPGPTSVSQDTGLDFGSGGLSLGQLPGSSNPELNFTDMHFSLAPAPADSQNATQQSESVFDLDAFLAGETMPSAPADNSGGGGTAGQAEVAPMDIPMPTVEASKEPAKVDDTNLDDLFDLNGTSMDMGLDGEGVDGTTNFDEMFFEAGDTEMGEFDNAYFGLDG